MASGCEDGGAATVGAEAAPWGRPLGVRKLDEFPRRIPRATSGADAVILSIPEAVVAASVLSAEVLLDIAPSQVRAVHRLAADPTYSAVAAEALAMGKLTEGTPEHIVSFAPDVVFSDPFTHATTQSQLEQLGVVVVRLRPVESFEDIRQNIRLLGYALGKDVAAETLVVHMNSILEGAARPEGRSLRVLNLSMDLVTLGAGSLMDAMIRHLGCVNVAAERQCGPYARLDEEHVLDWAPDVLVMVGDDEDVVSRERRRLRDDPALGSLECVREGRVVFLPGHLLSSTSHHLAVATARLARELDPWR